MTQYSLLQQLCGSELLLGTIFRPERFQKRTASGAAGANMLYEKGELDRWVLDEQRISGDRLEAGIVHRLTSGDDKGFIADAEKELVWPFDRQEADGGWNCADPFHCTEIFVESTARGLLLLRQSGLPEYAGLIGRYTSKLYRAGCWMLDSEAAKRGIQHNRPYTHRSYILAAALGQLGALTDEARFYRAAEEFARSGIALMTKEGLSPEKGGIDASYMNAGALNALRYLPWCRDQGLQQQLRYMIDCTLRYVSARVDENGRVSTEGDKRTSGSERHRDGSVKHFNHSEAIMVFTLGSYVLDRPELRITAARIAGRGVHDIYMK